MADQVLARAYWARAKEIIGEIVAITRRIDGVSEPLFPDTWITDNKGNIETIKDLQAELDDVMLRWKQASQVQR